MRKCIRDGSRCFARFWGLASVSAFGLSTNGLSATYVEDAVRIDITQDNFTAIVETMKADYEGKVLEGEDLETKVTDLGFTKITVDGISYSTEVSELQVALAAGKIETSFALTQFRPMVHRLATTVPYTDCVNMPIESEAPIPVSFSLVPTVSGGTLTLTADAVDMTLTKENFSFGEPEDCRGSLGTLTQFVLPLVLDLFRSQLETELESAIGEEVARQGESLNESLGQTVEKDVGFDLVEMFMTLVTAPRALDIRASGLHVSLDAMVNFEATGEESDEESSSIPPMTISVSDRLIKGSVVEIQRKNLLPIALDYELFPYDTLFGIGALSPITPDAASRFPADATFGFKLSKAQTVQVRYVNDSDNHTTIRIENLSMAGKTDVQGEEYFNFTTDFTMPIAFGIEPDGLAVGLKRVEASLVGGQFADSLSPRPSNTSIDRAAYTAYVENFNDEVLGSGLILTQDLPEFPFGDQITTFTQVSAGNGFLSIVIDAVP